MKINKPEIGNICAVIVTYHPDNHFDERVKRIARQVDSVVIVDNNSNEESVYMIHNLSKDMKVHLILNNENLGIATAINQGVVWAKVNGYQWVLTFDQDTVVENYLVRTLIGVYETINEREKIGIIASNFRDSYSQRSLSVFNSNNADYAWEERKTVITSGSLLSIKAYDEIGPFRDEFFIDFVDLEYCLRLRSKGFKVFLACKPLMLHAIGASTLHNLLWKKTGTSNHSVIRRYYMSRNHMVLIKEYFFKEPIWVATTIFSRIKSIILICLYENFRLTKLKYILLGFLDGITSNFTRFHKT